MERLAVTLLIVALKLIGLLPLRGMQAIGAFLGDLAWRLNIGLVRITRINIQRCFPELSAEAQEALVRDSVRENGHAAFEFAASWTWPSQRLLKKIRPSADEYRIIQALESGKGVILLGPHTGNWEAGGLYLTSMFPVASLYQPPSVDSLEDFMLRVRERSGSELVPTNKRGVMRLLQILRGGGAIAILPDQVPPPGSGVIAPFFGNPCATMKLVGKLVEKTDTVVFVGACIRLPKGQGFQMHFTEVDDGIYSPDIETSAAALNRAVEWSVKLAPAQYQWEYKRFKGTEAGDEPIYPVKRRLKKRLKAIFAKSPA